MIVDHKILVKALILYQKDWVKTEHNSFIPDMYVFRNILSSDDTWPYIVRASESLKLETRTLKLKKIRSKINGQV